MIGAANLQQLQPALNTRIPDCSVGMQYRELQNAAVDFCKMSKAWKQNLTPITTVAAEWIYTVTNNWQADILAIDRIGIRTAAEIADDADDDGSEIPSTGYKFIPEDMKLKFDSAPSGAAVTDALLVRAILAPQHESWEIAEWFLNQYREGIIAGAAASILSKPMFYNEALLRRERVRFNNEVAQAIADCRSRFTTEPLTCGKGYDLI